MSLFRTTQLCSNLTRSIGVRSLAVKATVDGTYDSRDHAFFAPVDPVQRIYFERIRENEFEVRAALNKPYTRTPAEIKELEKFLAAEREKLGLTDAAFDVTVPKTVKGNIDNLRQFAKEQANKA
eukprot:c4752_g1_i1.p1 GENE.c4752_g1_i1~~c4752_g1_i1.p1  ORF type:complete len:124 (-),score=45.58 c4752_g1_i1:45-416(-)